MQGKAPQGMRNNFNAAASVQSRTVQQQIIEETAMSTEQKADLAQVMLVHLIKHYTTEQAFSAPGLYHLAEKHGQKKPKTAANNNLRKLVAAGFVRRTDAVIENKNGGSDMPLYRLTGKVSNGTIQSKTTSPYAANAEIYSLNAVQLNLQRILDNITRERVTSA